jgi:hypothetical protein
MLAKRLRLKLGAYISYFVDRPSASQNQVLVVAPTDQREEQVARVAFSVLPRGRECCRVWTTTTARLAASGPLSNVWRGVERSTTLRIALPFMAGRPRSSRRVEDCIGKPRWERRPGGGQGA